MVHAEVMVRDVLAGDVSRRLSASELLVIAQAPLSLLMRAAAARRDAGHGDVVSYSRKVFLPLTHLCRDVCHYCTFARKPEPGRRAFMSMEEVLGVARAGAAAGCKEALFTLGDKPELRYRVVRDELCDLGHETTVSYLLEAARVVFRETGLLPHVNPGVMTAEDIARLREVSVSQGMMLESVATRLCDKGGPHFGSPDKHPAVRMETIRLAGEAAVPFTTGLLIGIGETFDERLEALLALRELQERYGHLQEVIIQNFLPKPHTRLSAQPSPQEEDHLRAIAIARLVFEPSMNIQAPPNLSPGRHSKIIDAGINDWGGISPVTPDFVNPEAPWPQIHRLSSVTRASGKTLVERLAIYPAYAREPLRWVASDLRTALVRAVDAEGFPRTDGWSPGALVEAPAATLPAGPAHIGAVSALRPIIDRALAGRALDERDIVALFGARDQAFQTVCAAADELRRDRNGDSVTYVVNRNINYTNVCGYRCQFCAFAKGKTSENLRGKPYNLPLDEIASRVVEAWSRGATEVCMQGGIHPAYTGQTYLDICAAAKSAVPGIHVHAFSPLEIFQGAKTTNSSIEEFLGELRSAGLGTLPGTAAEILDDEVRAILCPDKIRTHQWLDVMRVAHKVGLRSTATIMFGHIERPEHCARHLLRVRGLQEETGGFTEFVPLPFVHMETPIYRKGLARKGPTFRESVLMHAVARLALNPVIGNIQVSWVKMGVEGVRACLNAGVNDLGGTLMDESISRAAGAAHGQCMTPSSMTDICRSVGRTVKQRTTLYGNTEGHEVQRDHESWHTLTPVGCGSQPI